MVNGLDFRLLLYLFESPRSRPFGDFYLCWCFEQTVSWGYLTVFPFLPPLKSLLSYLSTWLLTTIKLNETHLKWSRAEELNRWSVDSRKHPVISVMSPWDQVFQLFPACVDSTVSSNTSSHLNYMALVLTVQTGTGFLTLHLSPHRNAWFLRLSQKGTQLLPLIFFITFSCTSAFLWGMLAESH